MDEEGALKPIAAVISELRNLYGFTDNRWEAWCEADLVKCAVPIAGTNAYGISEAAYKRLRELVKIDSELFGRKTPRKLAYHAALAGIGEIPPQLVAEHIEDGVRFAYRQMRRSINRFSDGKYKIDFLRPERVGSLADEIATQFIKGLPLRKPQLLVFREFYKNVVIVIISLTYLKNKPVLLESRLKTVAHAVFHRDDALLGFRLLTKIINRDKASFVDPDLADNSLIEDARSAPDHLEELGLALSDSRAVIGTLMQQFRDPASPTQPFPERPSAKERDQIKTAMYMLPMITAVMLQTELHNPSKLLHKLRETKGHNFREFLETLERVHNMAMRRYGQKDSA